MSRNPVTIPLLLVLWLWGASGAALAQPIQVRVERWLEVEQLFGDVFFQRGQNSQPAQVGMRLEAVGDTLRTSSRSNAVLSLDTNMGIITVSPNTSVRIEQLDTTERGGRLTRLRVTGGQARFQIRPFNNPDSTLEIETPAGSSAVRGTEFGVSVQPDGTTGVATLEGSILTAAAGSSVIVDAGFQTLVIPGEPPQNPVPVVDGGQLRLELLTSIDDQTVRVSGQTDPVNLLRIADEPLSLDRTGRFDVLVPLPPDRSIEAIVVTPSGLQQQYRLAVPPRD